MRQVCFRCCSGICHYLPDFSCSLRLHITKRKLHDMFHHFDSQVCLNPERRLMRTHQCRNIKHHGQQGKSNRLPAVRCNMYRPVKIRPDLQNFFYDAEHIIKRNQRNPCTDCCQNTGQIRQVLMISRNVHQS